MTNFESEVDFCYLTKAAFVFFWFSHEFKEKLQQTVCERKWKPEQLSGKNASFSVVMEVQLAVIGHENHSHLRKTSPRIGQFVVRRYLNFSTIGSKQEKLCLFV